MVDMDEIDLKDKGVDNPGLTRSYSEPTLTQIDREFTVSNSESDLAHMHHELSSANSESALTHMGRGLSNANSETALTMGRGLSSANSELSLGPIRSGLDSSSLASSMIQLQREERQHKSRNTRNKKLKRYYKSQTELLQSVDDIRAELDEYREDEVTTSRIASAEFMAKLVLFINVCLFGGKLAGAVLSGSLAVISTVVDSALDLVSGTLLWYSSRAAEHFNPYRYPRGRRRLEPVSVIVISVVMTMSAVIIIQNAIMGLATHANYASKCKWHPTNETEDMCGSVKELSDLIKPCASGDGGPSVGAPTLTICCIVIVTKAILYILCRTNKNPIVQALTLDQRNDVLSNTGAIVMGSIGTYLWVYADSIGAILISSYIISQWFLIAIGQIKMLTGHTATPKVINMLTWVVANHDERILYVDGLKAFHFGTNYLVEADIVLPANMTIQESHDIAETLTIKLEKLENIERAFVHVDYLCGYTHHVNETEMSLNEAEA